MKLFLAFTFLLCSGSILAQNYEDSIREARVKYFSELIDPKSGILKAEEIEHFQELDYFLIDTTYRINAKFTKDKGKKFKMPTSTDREPIYRRYGYVDFKVGDSMHRLTIYQNLELKPKKEFKNYLFLPFRDLTSGTDSYGGGRYLDLQRTKSNQILLDFNKCYNPYCAYSERYSCPIPPAENTLKTSISAGEKTPKGH